MNEDHVVARRWWSVVVLMAALAALVAAAIIVRTSPPAAGDTSDGRVVAGRAVNPVDRVRLAVGEQATLFKNDAFKVVAVCIDEGAGVVTAGYGVRARQENTLVFSTDLANETDTSLDPADGLFRWSSQEPSSDTAVYKGYDYYQEFTGESRRGNLLIGRVSAGVNMRGADCIYNGLFIA